MSVKIKILFFLIGVITLFLFNFHVVYPLVLDRQYGLFIYWCNYSGVLYGSVGVRWVIPDEVMEKWFVDKFR